MSKALDNFTEGVKHLIQTAIDKAPFDKTYKGRVLSVANGEYTVLINGKEYPNTPVQGGGGFAVDEVVKVVFPQNNATLRYILNAGNGGGIADAPADGKQYARQNHSWTEVQVSGAGLTQTEKNSLLTILGAAIVDPTKQDEVDAALELLRTLWAGGQITIIQEGSKLIIMGVEPISTIVQSGSALVLT